MYKYKCNNNTLVSYFSAGVCGQCGKPISQHVEEKPKPKFYRRKLLGDLSDVEHGDVTLTTSNSRGEVLREQVDKQGDWYDMHRDKSGWVTDGVINAPSKLKSSGMDVEVTVTSNELPYKMDGCNILSKDGMSTKYYNKLVYDIQQEGDKITGKVWLMYIVLDVKLVVDHTWIILGRKKVWTDWYILQAEDGYVEFVSTTNGEIPVEYLDWYVYAGPYNNKEEAENDYYLGE